MAKDPAFLFYPGDWQGGTSTFSRFLKGCYMDVLIAQFNSGHLSLEEIKTVLGSDFGQSWPALQKKFKADPKGLFFNEKLQTEMIKRKEYSKSRADNRRGKDMKHISKTYEHTYVPHMENGDGNEIGIKIKKESDKNWYLPDVDGDELVFPLDTIPVHDLWASWKKYRWEKYQLSYGMMGEQADLKRLEGLNFHQIQETILAAISGQWKNLYPDKSQGNGKTNSGNKKQQHTANLAQSIAEHYASKLAGGPGNPNSQGADGK